jgi:hypothetical protein
MIKNQDRSKWFGASDTSMIMGNWQTKTFNDWWMVKLGITTNNVKTWAMECGNILEIPIIRFIEKDEGKKISIGRFPFYLRKYRLRCNYDGLRADEVIEIKTTSKPFKKIPKNYWQQCQVLMYRKKKKKCALYEYQMTEQDYLNPYFPTIDKNRLVRHEIKFSEQFIKNEYLPRLRVLARALKSKRFPKEQDICLV